MITIPYNLQIVLERPNQKKKLFGFRGSTKSKASNSFILFRP